jgi:hypothetical protein
MRDLPFDLAMHNASLRKDRDPSWMVIKLDGAIVLNRLLIQGNSICNFEIIELSCFVYNVDVTCNMVISIRESTSFGERHYSIFDFIFDDFYEVYK